MEIILFLLGGLGCLLMMGGMMWLVGRLMTRKGINVRALVRSVAHLRREGIRSTVKSSIQAVASWAEAERPNLRPAAAPDGTVTILFSDIEDSTTMNELLGDQGWIELLRSHKLIVRDQIRAHGGYEVKSQGDGFMVAFSSARRGLQCAIAIQRALAAERDGAGERPIRVRIGLHTGEAIKDEGDFYGRNVVLAARIADQAKGGEILASALVKELAVSGGDIEFEESGERELKGLFGAQRVYRVHWDPTGATRATREQPSRLAHGSSESSAA